MSAPPPPDGGEAFGEALTHLQRAALELIAAARNALDAAEEIARDPAPLAGLVEGVIGSLAGAFAPPAEDEPADGGPRSGPRVERIRVE